MPFGSGVITGGGRTKERVMPILNQLIRRGKIGFDSHSPDVAKKTDSTKYACIKI